MKIELSGIQFKMLENKPEKALFRLSTEYDREATFWEYPELEKSEKICVYRGENWKIEGLDKDGNVVFTANQTTESMEKTVGLIRLAMAIGFTLPIDKEGAFTPKRPEALQIIKNLETKKELLTFFAEDRLVKLPRKKYPKYSAMYYIDMACDTPIKITITHSSSNKKGSMKMFDLYWG